MIKAHNPNNLPTIDYRDLIELQPNSFKDLSQKNFDKLSNSFNVHGFITPYFVWKDKGKYFILDGHQRSRVLSTLEPNGLEVPYILIDAKNKQEAAKKLLAIDSRYGKRTAEGEQEFLDIFEIEQGYIEEVAVLEFEFETEDTEVEAKEDDFDEAPPEIPITVLGDLYEIGEHRLLCGDSTDSDQVAKLMNGNKADMVFTDPPYGVDFVGIKGTMYQNGKKKGKDSYEAIKNDDLKNESLTDLFYESISNAIINTKSNSAFYIFFGINKSKETIEAISNLDLEIRNWLIWDKGNVGFHAMGAQYKPNYESFLYCFKEGNPPEWVGNQQQQTIWRHSVERLGLHPTMKPITLISQAIENHNISSLLDLFLGSGSTMVASHQLKRKCYGMELDCRYADVIVKRMLKLDNTLKIKKNGVDETEKWLRKINESSDEEE